MVIRGSDDTLMTHLYRKPTAGNSILHASSFHPKPLLTSIPYSQYLRTRRNCSDDTSFQQEAKTLQKQPLERFYTKTCLKKAYKRAIENNRNELLYGTKKVKNLYNATRIIIKYSNQRSKIRKVIQKYWHLLSMDPNIGRFVSNTPSITFRWPLLLKNTLFKVSSKGRRDENHANLKVHTRVEDVATAGTYI